MECKVAQNPTNRNRIGNRVVEGKMPMITIIGRGHSGTRAISHTLYASGVYMGELLNPTGDMVPPDKLYDACRIISSYVKWESGLNWRFDALHTMPIPQEFRSLLFGYLGSLLKRDHLPLRGWKLPETTFVYPWLVRLFPEIKYIFWIRNPRDCLLAEHVTDDLAAFGIPHPETGDPRLQRAVSWKYQYDIVHSTPKPRAWLDIRFEDFVLRQDETLARLENFLGIRLAKIPVNAVAVDRWRQDPDVNYFDFLAPAMQEYGYEIPLQAEVLAST
jgi:Sulfotransferase family